MFLFIYNLLSAHIVLAEDFHPSWRWAALYVVGEAAAAAAAATSPPPFPLTASSIAAEATGTRPAHTSSPTLRMREAEISKPSLKDTLYSWKYRFVAFFQRDCALLLFDKCCPENTKWTHRNSILQQNTISFCELQGWIRMTMPEHNLFVYSSYTGYLKIWQLPRFLNQSTFYFSTYFPGYLR